MDASGNKEKRNFLQKAPLFTPTRTSTHAVDPQSSVWALSSPRGKDSLSPFPDGTATQSPSIPGPFPQWTPGAESGQMGGGNLLSQAAADAQLQPGPHDHLLSCTQVSPISGTFEASRSPKSPRSNSARLTDRHIDGPKDSGRILDLRNGIKGRTNLAQTQVTS